MISEIKIAYEDEHILIADKPNNVLVHHSYYARNISDDSLIQLIALQRELKVYPVNRLDRKTSGLILFSKRKEHVSDFQKLFDLDQIQKTYHGLLRGFLEQEMHIDSPVKNERGNYKSANSLFKPLQLFELNIPVKPYATSRYTLAELSPITGRTHQLRIHANKISHPIVGDHKYGNRHHNKMFEEYLGLSNLFLHSRSLSFKHPFSDKLINVTADYPEFWEVFLKEKYETFKI